MVPLGSVIPMAPVSLDKAVALLELSGCDSGVFCYSLAPLWAMQWQSSAVEGESGQDCGQQWIP